MEEPTQHFTSEDIIELAGSTALVTGANRGLGRHLAGQLIARGATVYAAAGNPAPGAIPITLDITDPASVETAAKATGNVTCRRAPTNGDAEDTA